MAERTPRLSERIYRDFPAGTGPVLKLDWRDVLVAGGVANADWPARLEQN